MGSRYDTKEKRSKFYKSVEWRGKNGMRNYILERDNYECEWCKQEGKVTTNEHAILEIDHIQEITERPDLALDENNLRILCKPHHNQRHDRLANWMFNKQDNWKDEKW